MVILSSMTPILTTFPRGKGWMWDDGPIGGYYSHQSALTINHNGVTVIVSPGAEIGGAGACAT